MSQITAAMVQELREATNVGMMECKRALVEAGGDKEKAIRLLRERGIAIAAKKAVRATNQGLITAHVTADGKAGAIVEVNCETDFVARNPVFQAFTGDLAKKAAGLDGDLAEAARNEVVAKITETGENIVIRRHLRYVLQEHGVIVAYIHLGGKVGVLLEMGCTLATTAAHAGFRELAHDLTLHVAACSPRYLQRSDVTADVVAAEREIYAKQVTGKPPAIVGKIVDGKMNKFYSQVCLLEQGFVKDPDTPVRKLIDAKGAELTDTFRIRRFVRWQLGE